MKSLLLSLTFLLSIGLFASEDKLQKCYDEAAIWHFTKLEEVKEKKEQDINSCEESDSYQDCMERVSEEYRQKLKSLDKIYHVRKRACLKIAY